VLADGLPFSDGRRDSRVPKMLPHRFFPKAAFAIWIDAKLELRTAPGVLVDRYLAGPRAELAAVRNLRRDTIEQEHAWIRSWMCPRGVCPRRGCPQGVCFTSATDDACVKVCEQMELYRSEQMERPGWIHQTAVIEGALLMLDLRSIATQCFLCSWFNEYALFGERDQLGFAYVMLSQRPRLRVNILPRSLHWSVTVEADTTACYNATEDGARTLATRFQHAVQGARAPGVGRASTRTKTRPMGGGWAADRRSTTGRGRARILPSRVGRQQ
jgi:hypothetical protein